MTPTPQYDAIIVGASHNGLVASWYLAHAGLLVLVLERREIVGGAVVTEELWPGYSVPTCSYICYLLQTRVIEDMQLREHGFDVHHLSPGSFWPAPDGGAILTWDEDERTAAEIGDLLFAVVNYARHLDVNPETALREATWRFEKRFRKVEEIADKPLNDMNIGELEELWQRAKKLV
mgnify:CR=1 FL=1